jgi:uncharacterized DUF497 family protein
MILEWDEAKRRSNLAKHGLDFADIRFLDWDSARFVEDTRQAYPEPRFWAFAKRAGELFVIVFCIRNGAVRVISYRAASDKETKRYG